MRAITKGEWSVRQGGDHGKDPQAYDVVCVSPETGYPHPIARGFWGGQADMTLCSASPNLLRACEAALLALERIDEGQGFEYHEIERKQLRAAIDKARGKK